MRNDREWLPVSLANRDVDLNSIVSSGHGRRRHLSIREPPVPTFFRPMDRSAERVKGCLANQLASQPVTGTGPMPSVVCGLEDEDIGGEMPSRGSSSSR